MSATRVALVLVLAVLPSSLRAQDLGRATDLATDTVAAPAVLEADPDAPTAGASIDRAEAYVGDRLVVTVTAIARGGIAVSLPQTLELGAVELLERDDADAKGRDLGDGRHSFRWTLHVSVYDVGPTELPALPLSYLSPRGEVRTVSTAPLPLSIRALVEGSTVTPDPQPARAPRSSLIEDARVMRAAFGLGALLVLLVLAFLARRIARRLQRQHGVERGPVVPSRPPGEVAIERLTVIRARGDYARDGYRPFAFETAEVVRAYLGARYGFDSLELTSTELLAELERAAPHLSQPGSEVVRFLEDTDLMKFASAGASEAGAVALLDAAQAIVLATAPRLEVAAEMLSGPVRPPEPSETARGGPAGQRDGG